MGVQPDEIRASFDLAKQWISMRRNISLEVDLDSPRNIITDYPIIVGADWVVQTAYIEMNNHDFPDTHIYFIVCNNTWMTSAAGSGGSLYGAVINLGYRYTSNRTAGFAYVILHELGHCIGAGLHDDLHGQEVYSSTGFMGPYSPNMLFDYADDDWNDTSAPLDAWGSPENTGFHYRCRMYNQASVSGQANDPRGMAIVSIAGVANASAPPSPIIEDDKTDYYLQVDYDSRMYILVPEGNHTLLFREFNMTNGQVERTWRQKFDISSREIKYINCTIPIESSSGSFYYIAGGVVAVVVITLVAVYLVRKRIKRKRI